MSNIRITNRQLMEMHQRYLSDSFINGCVKQIAYLYEISVPKYYISENGSVQPVYDDSVNNLVAKITKMKDEYIASNYGKLLELSK